MAFRAKPLFILHDLSGGGAERTTLQLLADLSSSGFEPTLFVLKHKGEFLSEVPSQIQFEWALEGNANLHSNWRSVLQRLLKFARMSDVIVGALELDATYFAYLASTMLRKPGIGWVHTVLQEELSEFSVLHVLAAKWIYPRLKMVVFPSQGAADSLSSLVSLERKRIAVIPSYVNISSLQNLAAEPIAGSASQIFVKPTVIGVGRLVPVKGLDILIRAHARLRRSGLDSNLLILGEGPLRGDLERLVDTLGVQNSVFMPGFVPNPYSLIKAADVFALSSRFEGLPLVLLEALGLGSAVVAADCPGGPSEVLDGGRYGLMVPRQDEVALASGISRMLTDRSFRLAFKERAVDRAAEFNREKLLSKWVRILSN